MSFGESESLGESEPQDECDEEVRAALLLARARIAECAASTFKRHFAWRDDRVLEYTEFLFEQE